MVVASSPRRPLPATMLVVQHLDHDHDPEAVAIRAKVVADRSGHLAGAQRREQVGHLVIIGYCQVVEN